MEVEIVGIDKIVKLIMVGLILILTGCTATSEAKLGYWEKGFSDLSVWRCVEPFKPHSNKEC